MKVFFPYRLTSTLLVSAGMLFASCSNDSDPVSVPVVAAKSFSKDIKPIFEANGCQGCHGTNSGLKVDSVSTLLKGGLHGPAIIAGNADASILIQKVSATPPFGDRMPRFRSALTDGEIAILKTWINEGAKDN